MAKKEKIWIDIYGDVVPARHVNKFDKARDAVSRRIHKRFMDERRRLEQLVKDCIADLDELMKLKASVGVKGNFQTSSFDGNIQVSIDQQYTVQLDERVAKARELMLEYVNSELARLDMLLAQGDRELARIAFYNCTDENYVFRLEPAADRRNRGVFTFLDVIPWRTPAGQVQHEIVSSLGSAGTICVPSGETKTILLAADTERPAGKYDWSFEIVPVNADVPTRRISVSAEVLDLAIRKDCLPLGYLFGPYNTGAAVGRIGAYRSFLTERNRVTHVAAGTSPWSRLLVKDGSGAVCLDETCFSIFKDFSDYTILPFLTKVFQANPHIFIFFK